jgi:hypothetical protein
MSISAMDDINLKGYFVGLLNKPFL